MKKKMTRKEVIEFVEAARNAGVVADLSRVDLYGVDLRGASLAGANLHRADLFGADLSDVNLTMANLSWADLSKANLYGANLYGVDLSGAVMFWADLGWANLSCVNLSWADLSGANLSKATGLICLNIIDPRGYRPVAVWHEDHWMVSARCCYFTVEDAMKYWGPWYTGDREIGDRYLKGIETLKTMRGE